MYELYYTVYNISETFHGHSGVKILVKTAGSKQNKHDKLETQKDEKTISTLPVACIHSSSTW